MSDAMQEQRPYDSPPIRPHRPDWRDEVARDAAKYMSQHRDADGMVMMERMAER